jgi:PHP family Zn ribbon phosphoesterase
MKHFECTRCYLIFKLTNAMADLCYDNPYCPKCGLLVGTMVRERAGTRGQVVMRPIHTGPSRRRKHIEGSR